MTADRRHHRRLGFGRRRRHPGRPQDLLRARRLRRARHHRADRAEHQGRHRHPRRAAGFHHRADRCGVLRPRRGRGEDRHAVAARGDRGGRRRARPLAAASNVVLDPVMVATSGDRLLAPDAIDVLKRVLDSARAGHHAESAGSGRAARRAARPQRARDAARRPGGCCALGRAGRADQGRPRRRRRKRRHAGDGARRSRGSRRRGSTPENTHGTGCTLSSAIAAGLAKGLDLVDAAREAKVYVTAAIAASDRLQVGSGHGPVHHFHAWW